jgi:DNA replication protein DnaC
MVAGNVPLVPPAQLNRKQIRAFAELDFVAQHQNLVFVGQTGVGKTGLASGLLLKALQNGYRCQFIRAQDLFDENVITQTGERVQQDRRAHRTPLLLGARFAEALQHTLLVLAEN